ncbi:MAG: hypothetical protein JXR03_00715 [Cyclobacteriaceae bacterium]
MKKLTGVILLTSIMVFSCDDNMIKEGKTEYHYYEGASISDNNPIVVEGDRTVFNRHFVGDDNEQIADDEFSENFYFEVDPDLNEFSFKDEELKNINLRYQHLCFCVPIDSIIIVGGSISGNKVGEKWKISADVDLKLGYDYGSDSIIFDHEVNQKFTGDFTKQEIPK